MILLICGPSVESWSAHVQHGLEQHKERIDQTGFYWFLESCFNWHPKICRVSDPRSTRTCIPDHPWQVPKTKYLQCPEGKLVNAGGVHNNEAWYYSQSVAPPGIITWTTFKTIELYLFSGDSRIRQLWLEIGVPGGVFHACASNLYDWSATSDFNANDELFRRSYRTRVVLGVKNHT